MSSNAPYRTPNPATAPTTMSPSQLSMPSDPSQQPHPSMPPPLSHQPYAHPPPHAHHPYAFGPPPPHAPPGSSVPLSPTNPRKRRYSEDTIPTPSTVTSAMGVPPSAPSSAVSYPEPPEGPYQYPGAGAMVGRDVGIPPLDPGGHVPGVSIPPPSTPQGPPPKKSRTNTPWTPAEEQKLKTLRDAGSSWSEIAKEFPGRTEGSVKKHWYKDMHYAEFAADESAALLAAIKDYEASKWKVIGQKLGKPAKACEQYAKEHFGGKI